MNTQTLPPVDILSSLNQMIAEAAMQLPPLIHAQDEAFIQGMQQATADAFWIRYLSELSEEAQKNFQKAMEQGTALAMQDWLTTYANFKEDQIANERARNVLDGMKQDLLDIVKTQYKNA